MRDCDNMRMLISGQHIENNIHEQSIRVEEEVTAIYGDVNIYPCQCAMKYTR